MSFDLDKFEYDMSVLFQTYIILEFIDEVIKKHKIRTVPVISIKNDGQVYIQHGTHKEKHSVPLYKFHLMFQPDKIEEVLTSLLLNNDTFPSYKILNYNIKDFKV